MHVAGYTNVLLGYTSMLLRYTGMLLGYTSMLHVAEMHTLCTEPFVPDLVSNAMCFCSVYQEKIEGPVIKVLVYGHLHNSKHEHSCGRIWSGSSARLVLVNINTVVVVVVVVVVAVVKLKTI